MKISGFTTKKDGWQKELINKVGEEGKSVTFPLQATDMIVEKDPFIDIDKTILRFPDGTPLDYSIKE